MTDPTVVLRKLVMLRDHAQRARDRRPASAQALAGDLVLQDALAMSLLVAIQEMLDICFHIVSDEGWGVPASYAEGLDLLGQHGVIDPDLAVALSGMAALRNRMAHGYASVDHERLWNELPAGLAALDGFVAAVARFMGTA